MNNSEKILKVLSDLIENGILTSKDIKKEISTDLKFKKDKIINRLDLVPREEFEVLKKIVQKQEKIINKLMKKKSGESGGDSNFSKQSVSKVFDGIRTSSYPSTAFKVDSLGQRILDLQGNEPAYIHGENVTISNAMNHPLYLDKDPTFTNYVNNQAYTVEGINVAYVNTQISNFRTGNAPDQEDLEKRDTLKSWSIILSISTFTLSVCGTFLVRSGILNSVHTFANDPDRGLYILIFLFFLIFASLIIFFIYENKLKNTNVAFGILTKESSILINNWFVMYFLAVILVGTIYPIFLEVISNHKISVGPPFFNKLIIPFLIPFLIFMSIGPNFNWIKNVKFKNKIPLIFFLILNIIIAFLILKNIGEAKLNLTLLLAASIYLFFTTFKDLIKKTKFKNYSQQISHFGFALLILSIVMNAFLSREITTNLKVGEEINFNDNKIKFENVEINDVKNYKKLTAFFTIQENSSNFLFKPEIRIYNQPVIITSEADIKTNIFMDRFLVINLIKEDYEYFNVRYQEKPLMIWIWLSVLLIIFGGLSNLLIKNEK